MMVHYGRQDTMTDSVDLVHQYFEYTNPGYLIVQLFSWQHLLAVANGIWMGTGGIGHVVEALAVNMPHLYYCGTVYSCGWQQYGLKDRT